MITAFVKHKVKDYDAWKRVYDEFNSTRKENGVIAASVHRDINNPNMIYIMHQFKSMNTASEFLSSDKLKSAMEGAGVISEPEIWLGEDVEHTPY